MRSLIFEIPHLSAADLMKRSRSLSLRSTLELTSPPSTPPRTLAFDSSPLSEASKALSSSRRIKRSLSESLKTQKLPTPCPTEDWVRLNLAKSELSLPLTFPTGQTFRWKKTGALQYTGVVKSHLISLRHLEDGHVAYKIHASCSETTEGDDAKFALHDFLNVGICLTDMWNGFAASDERFAELAPPLTGARVLRQDPLECLIQFLCSSNNNIGRITKMVDYLSSLGNYVGTFEGVEFFEFPSLDRLGFISEKDLRKAGFGYRAKYLVNTIKALEGKPGGGVEWLFSLRESGLEETMSALTTLPGVGPKVAACVALFSLDQHHAVPVDTHVWQIATRYLIPELAGVRLSPKLHSRVAEAFVRRYGKFAGWAQTLLFVAELPSQKELIGSQVSVVKEKKTMHKKEV